MSKIDSLTRSVVGRTVAGNDARSALPLADPLTTRTRRIVSLDSPFKEPRRVLRIKRDLQLFSKQAVPHQARIIGNESLSNRPS